VDRSLDGIIVLEPRKEIVGRFQVAKIIARVFPDYRQFVRDVIAEGHLVLRFWVPADLLERKEVSWTGRSFGDRLPL
jgi:hypothetical protein